MTKTLTEKWKDETLKGGFYWLKVDVGGGEYIDIVEYDEDSKDFVRYYNDYIKEVLAPVPSYYEYKEMEHIKECLKLSRNKVVKLQERLEEAERFVKHDAFSERLFGFTHIDRHGVEHSTREATNYCEKYGLEPERYSMYELHKFKKIIYKEDIAREYGIYTHPSIQMESLGYKIEHVELNSVGHNWSFWVDDYIEPMPEYLEKSGV